MDTTNSNSVVNDFDSTSLTDVGNADRLVRQHGHHLRYVAQWGWVVYDGKRWVRDEVGAVMEKAKETALSIYQEAAQAAKEGDTRNANNLAQLAKRSQAKLRLDAMVALAQSDARIVAKAADFDTHPWLFNVQNGTLDLKTGELWPHNPQHLITHLANAEYSAEATSPVWDTFITDIACNDEPTIRYLQEAIGYSLTGLTTAKKFFFCHGAQGDNGKSTLLEALRFMFGDYADALDSDSLMANKRAVRNDLAKLPGKRFVTSSELRQGDKFDTVALKQWTGSDTLAVRFLYNEEFLMRPQFKLWLAANDTPEVPDTGRAMWERFQLVPFRAFFPPGHPKRDEAMPEKLEAAAAAILAWAVNGCRMWQEKGLEVPDTVKQATAKYREEQNPLKQFIDEMCVPGDGYVRSKELRDLYDTWRVHNEGPTYSPQAFNKALEGMGYDNTKANVGIVIKGLRLAERPANMSDMPQRGAAAPLKKAVNDDRLPWDTPDDDPRLAALLATADDDDEEFLPF